MPSSAVHLPEPVDLIPNSEDMTAAQRQTPSATSLRAVGCAAQPLDPLNHEGEWKAGPFKPLTYRVVCYIVIDNQNIIHYTNIKEISLF